MEEEWPQPWRRRRETSGGRRGDRLTGGPIIFYYLFE
jgi:hypothetical protein